MIHAELPEGDEQVHSLQLWLNLPRDKKMVAAHYQDIRAASMPMWEGPGIRVRAWTT